MKKISLFVLLLPMLQAAAQVDSTQAVREIVAFQEKLTEEFKNRDESPLTDKDFAVFEAHDFFSIDLAYRVNATLSISENTPFFGMKTTTSRLATERIYGYVDFTLQGEHFRLPVYQSKDLMQTEEYADYLFFPFTDETNGKETYGGGRYIDLRVPTEGNVIVVDFNKAYNPYCAYSTNYSCPIVPAENQMRVEVRAGVKYKEKEQSKEVLAERVEVQPQYPGGYEAMTKFIQKNLVYPKAARRAKVSGMVYITFVIGRDGSVSDARTLKGISPECDQEAERVVRMMPRWTPGKLNGETVPVAFTLPIAFNR